MLLMPKNDAVKEFELSQTFILFLVSIAGLTDAAFYLHSKDLLGVYFTGDTSKLAQFLQKGDLQKSFPLVGVIVTFLASTTLAAWLGNLLKKRRALPLLLIVAGLVFAAWPISAPDYPYSAVLLLVMAMGVLNQVGSQEPGVTFITGTLVKLGRALSRGDLRQGLPLALRWLVWFAAALVGAWIESTSAHYTLLLIALWALLLTVVSPFFEKTKQ
jgi:uncharacterized membrane protein YoaK (UPF0700 family)